MAPARLQFKRLLLGLQAGSTGPAMDLAIDFAHLLDLELIGVLLEDAGLRRLARIAPTRAIRAAGGGWRDVDWDQVARDLDLAASGAESQFADLTRGLARRQFEVVRGGAAFALSSMSRAGDILVIDAPASAAERVAEPFASLVEAAFRSAASVMLAPRRSVRRAGPIAAIAGRPDDPSIGMAAAIAQLAGEAATIIQVRSHASIDTLQSPRIGRFADALRRGAPGIFDVAAEATGQALRQSGARLAVMSRSEPAADLALAIELSRFLPVLSIDGSGSENIEPGGP